MCCDLMSTEDLCNESPGVENASEVNEECAFVPTTDDFIFIFLGGLL